MKSRKEGKIVGLSEGSPQLKSGKQKQAQSQVEKSVDSVIFPGYCWLFVSVRSLLPLWRPHKSFFRHFSGFWSRGWAMAMVTGNCGALLHISTSCIFDGFLGLRLASTTAF